MTTKQETKTNYLTQARQEFAGKLDAFAAGELSADDFVELEVEARRQSFVAGRNSRYAKKPEAETVEANEG